MKLQKRKVERVFGMARFPSLAITLALLAFSVSSCGGSGSSGPLEVSDLNSSVECLAPNGTYKAICEVTIQNLTKKSGWVLVSWKMNDQNGHWAYGMVTNEITLNPAKIEVGPEAYVTVSSTTTWTKPVSGGLTVADVNVTILE